MGQSQSANQAANHNTNHNNHNNNQTNNSNNQTQTDTVAATTAEMSGDEKADHLTLSTNPKVAQMLQKKGDKGLRETVLFSDLVIKINRKDKEQTRVLLITDRAVYNLLPNDYTTCKRRIPLDKIFACTASSITDEFVVHVAGEYDYRFKSAKKKQICEIMKAAQSKVKAKDQEKLAVVFIAASDLKDMALTKAAARLQTREDELKRAKDLVAQAHESDKEDDEESKDTVTQLLQNTEKVRLEDFELLKVLGRGSFGKVMQVRKKDSGKIFAMKILKKKAIVERHQVEHTKAERKILESLQHPFLMTLRFAFQSKEKLYFVLDYYTGGELFFHLKTKRRFSEETGRIYVAEIASALGHLHSLGYVYRDLKPENILLDENGHCCLTDFGLSKDIAPDDQAHTFCGTPEYLAPEIVSGAGHNKAVDWWSLGILLYELTVGIPPFYSQNVNEMYNKIQHGILRFPPFLTEDCKNAVIALLNRDPVKRCGSQNDLEDVKALPFFRVLDWDKLMAKQLDTGYHPKVKSNADASNFDEQFTSEPVVDSVVPTSQLSKTVDQDSFGGFTYAPKNNHLHDS